MLRQMSAAFCGVLIIFACSVPTKAAAKPARLATRTKVQADVTKLPPFIGAASTYNPFRPGPGEGGKLTASGENYSANSWTAAIQTNLRRFFSGVFSGKAYRPRFALVENATRPPLTVRFPGFTKSEADVERTPLDPIAVRLRKPSFPL